MWATAEKFYFRALFHFTRIFGILVRAVAVLIGFWALTSLMRLTHFGYPDFTIVLLCVFYAAGHYISKFGRFLLRSLQ